MSDKCFAKSARNGCSVLNTGACPGYGKCSFYKTRAQANRDRKATFKRLISLSGAEQDYISEKYYDGKMPWRGEIA